MSENGSVENLIQEKWKDELCPGVNGVLFSDGELILMECVLLMHERGAQVRVRPLARSTLRSALEFNENLWAFITELASYSWAEGNIRLSCGEGSMGSDGYVAAVRISDDRLVWAAFFDCSNPFEEIKVVNGEVVVVSTYGHRWSFPIEHPERVMVQS
ncbi:hypothetical protein POL68_23465 [Stigmatella sp. ncwal1]|uniref:Uncharacterized protein n=1 Tax=Stigmatella ashevillensis TaxID=2995309 RepID=A0ABT5DCQ1_9BACT|nr:hypothetical protein [Stigmatella ashevillena]MDC0711450.1 hypothetical protein [Stigmatella ashevillena]